MTTSGDSSVGMKWANEKLRAETEGVQRGIDRRLTVLDSGAMQGRGGMEGS